MGTQNALLVVDVQKDFLPGGALPVPEGDKIIPTLNAYIQTFERQGWPIFFSRDWHPQKTAHFCEYGGPWPPHCVQGTEGAAFAEGLLIPSNAIILSKGTSWEAESYSAFLGVDAAGTPLADLLRRQGVRCLYIGGLALDYCVKQSVLDALRQGFEAVLLIDATRAVNLQIHDAEEAIEAMVRAGAQVSTIERIEGQRGK